MSNSVESRTTDSALSSEHNPADSQLIRDLHKLHERSPKLVRPSRHHPPAWPELEIESWKMAEHKYNVVPSPFPTLARGLFTVQLDGDKRKCTESRFRIVARGYDKFFNIGEVPWTTWDSIAKYTSPPYYLTLKSNGCIIFIAPLSEDKLVVCSKHSLGPVTDKEESHAQAGERWLEHHLATAGKTKSQLAMKLFQENWTVVAELCDDEFEEHVLPYSREKSGLHLHGINENSGLFKTRPLDVVRSFAEEWGFISTPYTTKHSASDVQDFTNMIAETGTWNGEPLEGFVVRTTVSVLAKDLTGKAECPPYAPGSCFFFKIKFDEPYMMYRDWREITKSILTFKGDPTNAKLPKSKMNRSETKLYVRWLIDEVKRDKTQFDGFTKGHGIIRARERFLEWVRSQDGGGKAKLRTLEQEKVESTKSFDKTIIVPVAIPGAGKTTIAIALERLFHFGHTQSDDIVAKKPAPRFVKNVEGLLQAHDVVIADRNNHLQQHREQLRGITQRFDGSVRLLALNWALDELPKQTVHRICAERVLLRGTNHQTLHADEETGYHEDVIWKFLNTTEPLSSEEVDAVIEMNISDDLEQSLERAVDGVSRALGIPHPRPEDIGKAFASALEYKPSAISTKRKKASKPRYYGFILHGFDLRGVLDGVLASEGPPSGMKNFWRVIKEENKVAEHPHVTIVHSKGLPGDMELWEICTRVCESERAPIFKLRLGHALSDGRVFALAVDDVIVNDDKGDEREGATFIASLRDDIRSRLHVTVGTREHSVAPIEAKHLVEHWRAGRQEGVDSYPLDNIWVEGRVTGLYS